MVTGSSSPMSALSRVERNMRGGTPGPLAINPLTYPPLTRRRVLAFGFVHQEMGVRRREALATVESTADCFAGGGVERDRFWPARNDEMAATYVANFESHDVFTTQGVKHCIEYATLVPSATATVSGSEDPEALMATPIQGR